MPKRSRKQPIDNYLEQVLLSAVMRDESQSVAVRLKATELLGRMQGDFVHPRKKRNMP
jgi:hypothetical protein